MKSWRYRLPVCLLFALLLTAVRAILSVPQSLLRRCGARTRLQGTWTR